MTLSETERLKADAAWGRALWDWIREMLPNAGLCIEIDTEELMKLAEKHAKAKKVKYDPAVHGDNIEAEPGSEIWWWGD